MKILPLFLSLALLTEMARGASVTLSWTASIDPNVIGYNIYQGPGSRSYTNTTQVGRITTYSLTNLLAGGTYFFSLTAFTAGGLESPFSNEVSYTSPAVPPVFTLNPVSSTNDYGTATTLTGQASNATSYQWLFNSVAIPGATSSSLSLLFLTWTNNGNYALAAANSSGTVLSTAAKISVRPPVVANLQVSGP